MIKSNNEPTENGEITVLPGFVKQAEFAKNNTHLFSSLRALQQFTIEHRDALMRRNAVARLGPGRNAPVLVHPERLQQYLRESAGVANEQ